MENIFQQLKKIDSNLTVILRKTYIIITKENTNN